MNKLYNCFNLKQRTFPLRALFLSFALLWSGLAHAQLILNTDLTSSVASVPSGATYVYSIFYSTQSPTLAATNAHIQVPFPSGMTLISFQGTGHVAGYSIIMVMGVPTLDIEMIDPLPAGSAGIIDIEVLVPAGTVCDGTVVTTHSTFSADNASNSPERSLWLLRAIPLSFLWISSRLLPLAM